MNTRFSLVLGEVINTGVIEGCVQDLDEASGDRQSMMVDRTKALIQWGIDSCTEGWKDSWEIGASKLGGKIRYQISMNEISDVGQYLDKAHRRLTSLLSKLTPCIPRGWTEGINRSLLQGIVIGPFDEMLTKSLSKLLRETRPSSKRSAEEMGGGDAGQNSKRMDEEKTGKSGEPSGFQLLSLLDQALDCNQPAQLKFLNFYFEFVQSTLKDIETGLKEGEGSKQGGGQFFDSIYSFYTQQTDLISLAFRNSYPMRTELTRAFEQISSSDPDRAADLLCRYFSDRLADTSDEQVSEHSWECLLALFKHLPSKDIFLKLYNQRLIRRLVSDKSTGISREREMVDRMEKLAGEAATHPSHMILQQFERSTEGMKSFEELMVRKQSRQTASTPSIDVQTVRIYVFPSHIWPFPKLITVDDVLPAEMKKIAMEYKEYFSEKEPAQCVDFQYEANSCDLWASFPSGRYLLESISLLQCMILFILNHSADFTYGQLKSAFPPLTAHISSHLIPLCKGGPRQILLKKPDTQSFKDSDVFTLNTEFVSKKKKITFNTMIKRESKEDIQQTREKVLEERLYSIESMIVRILKETKSIKHQELANRVVQGLKLPLTSKDIAKCVDGLISRDYMRRDDDDMQLYHYIA